MKIFNIHILIVITLFSTLLEASDGDSLLGDLNPKNFDCAPFSGMFLSPTERESLLYKYYMTKPKPVFQPQCNKCIPDLWVVLGVEKVAFIVKFVIDTSGTILPESETIIARKIYTSHGIETIGMDSLVFRDIELQLIECLHKEWRFTPASCGPHKVRAWWRLPFSYRKP